MKAPNGKPTKLTERQWVQVRTENFKRWFGDWEAAAEVAPRTLADAKAVVLDLIRANAEVVTADGVNLVFHGQAKKAWSKKAEMESDNSQAHWAALGNIDELCRRAVTLWEETPRNGSTDIRAYVKHGSVFTFGGEAYLAKITAKAYPGVERQNFYSVESVSVEKINARGIHKAIAKGQSLDTDVENTITQLLDSVKPENISKVVDENGEPMVVYHDTNSKRYVNRETGEDWDLLTPEQRDAWDGRDDWDDYWEEQDFYVFDRRKSRTGIEFPAHFFSPKADPYHEYGERRISAFLNIRNPAINPEIENRGRTYNTGAIQMEKLRNEGFDGFIREYDGVVEEIDAFDSNQIKSATDNAGTFSGRPDIRFSSADVNRVVEGTNVPVEQAEGEIRADLEASLASATEEFGEDISLVGLRLHGSRVRGDARADSDLDVVMEYSGDVREDDLFNFLNGDENRITYRGLSVDVNPIRAEETGTLGEYMERDAEYDAAKRLWRSCVAALGGNRIDAKTLSALSPDEAMRRLAEGLARGQTLGRAPKGRGGEAE